MPVFNFQIPILKPRSLRAVAKAATSNNSPAAKQPQTIQIPNSKFQIPNSNCHREPAERPNSSIAELPN
jgi:hypothetical protein